MTTIPEKSLESLEGPKNLKDELGGMFQKGKETIMDAGSIRRELAGVKDAAINASKGAVLGPLKALDRLARQHPSNIMEKFVSGAGSVFGGLTKVVTSPAQLGVTAGKRATGMSVKGAKILAQSPFYAWNTMERGVTKIFGLGGSFFSWFDEGLGKIMDAGKAG